MKLAKDVEKLLNEQINHEFHAAYLYLSMSAYFEKENLKGFSHWMKIQAKEETGHAMKIFEYLFSMNSSPALTKIDAPKISWKDSEEAFSDAYLHEQKVTKQIYNLVEKAQKAGDHATVNFLQWYVKEQVEEESNALETLEKIKMLKGHKPALYMLNKELGSRQ